MLSRAALEGLLTDAGLTLVDVATRPLQRPLEPWLAHTAVTPATARQIRAALETELSGEAATGFAPSLVDRELWFTQTFAACVAARPA